MAAEVRAIRRCMTFVWPLWRTNNDRSSSDHDCTSFVESYSVLCSLIGKSADGDTHRTLTFVIQSSLSPRSRLPWPLPSMDFPSPTLRHLCPLQTVLASLGSATTVSEGIAWQRRMNTADSLSLSSPSTAPSRLSTASLLRSCPECSKDVRPIERACVLVASVVNGGPCCPIPPRSGPRQSNGTSSLPTGTQSPVSVLFSSDPPLIWWSYRSLVSQRASRTGFLTTRGGLSPSKSPVPSLVRAISSRYRSPSIPRCPASEF